MFEEIKEIIAESLEVNPNLIKPETNLFLELDINSFELVNLICVFEDKYDIDISEREIKDIKLVKDVEEALLKIIDQKM